MSWRGRDAPRVGCVLGREITPELFLLKRPSPAWGRKTARTTMATFDARMQDLDHVTLDRKRRALLEAHLARVEHANTSVRRETRRAPWLLLSAILMLPVGLHWGAFAAFAALVASLILSGAGMYISWAHRQEYSSEAAAIRQQLADIEHARSHGPRERMRWRTEGKALQL
jgi:hypothetical protein